MTSDRAQFQPVELDDIDAKLQLTAAKKGIPSLSSTKPSSTNSTDALEPSKQAATRRTLSVEVPDYLWVDLKTTAARQMVSVRHLILSALREQGHEIADPDLVEDGRRLR